MLVNKLVSGAGVGVRGGRFLGEVGAVQQLIQHLFGDHIALLLALHRSVPAG